jgi:hypothetical protein
MALAVERIARPTIHSSSRQKELAVRIRSVAIELEAERQSRSALAYEQRGCSPLELALAQPGASNSSMVNVCFAWLAPAKPVGLCHGIYQSDASCMRRSQRRKSTSATR